MRKTVFAGKILPVCLLLEGRPCLVVGGGAVAARKAGHLLDAGASVTVVSPTLCAELAAWANDGRIRHEARPFVAADARGRALVVAATDRAAVNRRVITAARRHHALVGAADANWRDGDFITPAILRRGGVTVAVSTGGASCSRARALKERIARILEDPAS